MGSSPSITSSPGSGRQRKIERWDIEGKSKEKERERDEGRGRKKDSSGEKGRGKTDVIH